MLKSLLAAALLALSTLPAAAQNLIDANNERAVATFIQDQGYRAKLEYLDDGDPVIRSNSSGTNFSIYFFDCDRGTNCKTIQFFVSYDLNDGMTYEKVNEWNRGWRFGKVYLDDENDPFMELDVNIEYGVTHENLADTIDWWLVAMGNFEEFIDW